MVLFKWSEHIDLEQLCYFLPLKFMKSCQFVGKVTNKRWQLHRRLHSVFRSISNFTLMSSFPCDIKNQDITFVLKKLMKKLSENFVSPRTALHGTNYTTFSEIKRTPATNIAIYFYGYSLTFANNAFEVLTAIETSPTVQGNIKKAHS